ncbi:MAG: HPr family phosphocarrier protein, partial [Pseudomonadota bacterium]
MTDTTAPVRKRLEIINRKGLHARAAARFARCVEPYDAFMEVHRDGQTVGGDSIMGLLMLGAAQGCHIDVMATGVRSVVGRAAQAARDRSHQDPRRRSCLSPFDRRLALAVRRGR